MVEVAPVDILCSSEDPAFPAINLVRGALRSPDERKKWLCLGADKKSAFVIIKYVEPFLISSLELQNSGSAFIQVEGANSLEGSNYQILWKSQNLITASEAKAGINSDGTYSFLSQDLPPLEKNKKWDTIKIICSQPFLDCQFGLSYIISRTYLPVKKEPLVSDVVPVRGYSGMTSCSTFPTMVVKEEPLPSVTSFICDNQVSSHLSPSNVIKQEASSSEDVSLPRSVAQHSHFPEASGIQVFEVVDSSDEEISAHEITQTKRLLKRPADLPGPEARKRLKPSSIVYKPFHKLLEGVKLVISGFVNPQRSEIRTRALTMGATYSPYWSEDSTHLVCAFLYTPKYRQALGEGLIVTKNWIDDCFLQRKRLPWRRYALNISERNLDGNEEEVWELLAEVSSPGLKFCEHCMAFGNCSLTLNSSRAETSKNTSEIPESKPAGMAAMALPNFPVLVVPKTESEAEPSCLPTEPSISPLHSAPQTSSTTMPFQQSQLDNHSDLDGDHSL